jgi:hypothetical protein
MLRRLLGLERALGLDGCEGIWHAMAYLGLMNITCSVGRMLRRSGPVGGRPRPARRRTALLRQSALLGVHARLCAHPWVRLLTGPRALRQPSRVLVPAGIRLHARLCQFGRLRGRAGLRVCPRLRVPAGLCVHAVLRQPGRLRMPSGLCMHARLRMPARVRVHSRLPVPAGLRV